MGRPIVVDRGAALRPSLTTTPAWLTTAVLVAATAAAVLLMSIVLPAPRPATTPPAAASVADAFLSMEAPVGLSDAPDVAYGTDHVKTVGAKLARKVATNKETFADKDERVVSGINPALQDYDTVTAFPLTEGHVWRLPRHSRWFEIWYMVPPVPGVNEAPPSLVIQARHRGRWVEVSRSWSGHFYTTIEQGTTAIRVLPTAADPQPVIQEIHFG